MCTRAGLADLWLADLFVPSPLWFRRHAERTQNDRRLRALQKLETINNTPLGYSDYDSLDNATTGWDAPFFAE